MTAGPPDGRVRTVFLGSGGFGRPALRRLAAHRSVDLVGIVTAPPRPAGRQRRLTRTLIDEAGASLGIPVTLRPERLRAPEAVADVLHLEPELLVLADYGQIVPAALLDVPHGALNLHPSLLPRHRGAVPIPAAILEGDTETGVTLMRMDAGLDTGPIVAQDRIRLAGTEAAPDLEARLAEVAADLLDRSLAAWLAGALPSVPQQTEGATLTRPMRREDGRLDPARPAEELERRVRALQPWPGAFLDLDGERLVVGSASMAPAGTGDVTGAIVVEGRDPALATAHGRLVLVTVTPAGRRAMPGADWLRGRRVRESGG